MWYKTAPGYREQGPWGWDDNRLKDKISKEADENGCLNWQGSMSPSGALMGVWKNGHQQMSQVRRLLWMSLNNEDVTPYRVTMSCGNQACCNEKHFILKNNNRIGLYDC
jgi:hypothetical protein